MQITLRGKYQPNRKKNGPKTYEYGTIVLRVDALTGASRWEA